jgi:diguanylate cyclase
MTDDEFKKSTENLKRAVPLMMKNHVAATPTNYALWYAYVDNLIPALNDEIDSIINNGQPYLPATNTKLYQQYIASNDEIVASDLRSNMEVILQKIGSSVADTMSDTSAFSNAVKSRVDHLERVDKKNLSTDNVIQLIEQLVIDSREIRQSTNELTEQLSSACCEIDRLKNELAEVQKSAVIDGLTNLFNRRAFTADLYSMIESHNTQHTLCLILIDIDHFKQFNDTYGHLFGDLVLKALAKRLQMSCREGISAYRFGGEEFAVIVPSKSLRITRQYAESLRRNIEKMTIKDKKTGQKVNNITASFGVTDYISGESADKFIERTDALLYEAKKLGRNRVMPL